MAAFATLTKKFTRLINALLLSDGGFINRLNRTAMVPESTTAGAITARITTAVTLTAITDGTMAQNGAARTEVDLTAFRKQHVISLFPDQLAQFKGDPGAIEAELNAFVSAARVNAETEIVADLVAGTPAQVVTLPVGQVNFVTDGTDAEAYLALNALDKSVAFVRANTQGKSDEISILMPTLAYGNFLTLVGASRFGSAINIRPSGETFYRGIPVFVTTVTTNFGAVSKECAFIVHKDAEAVVMREVNIPTADFTFHGDGMWKYFFQTYGFAGLIQASHYASVLNPAS